AMATPAVAITPALVMPVTRAIPVTAPASFAVAGTHGLLPLTIARNLRIRAAVVLGTVAHALAAGLTLPRLRRIAPLGHFRLAVLAKLAGRKHAVLVGVDLRKDRFLPALCLVLGDLAVLVGVELLKQGDEHGGTAALRAVRLLC